MKIAKFLWVACAAAILSGCITAQPTIEKVPAADVNMVELAEVAEKAYSVTFTPVDKAELLAAVTAVLEENGYKVEKSNLDPFILTGKKNYEFTTGQKIGKALITALFSGASYGAPDKDMDYWFSIVASDVEADGVPMMKLSSTVMYRVNRTDGSVKRRRMAAFKDKLLDAMVEKAGAQKG